MKVKGKKYYFGFKKQLPDHRDFKFEKVVGPVAPVKLPPSVDLSPLIHRVKNQGNLGSCVAHGTTSEFEALQVARTGVDFAACRLQEYQNAMILDGAFNGQDNGATVRSGVKATAQYGLAPETDWPYNISQFADPIPSQAVSDALKAESTNYYLLDSAIGYQQTLLNIKTNLASIQESPTGLPAVYGTTVYAQIEEVDESGIINMPNDGESPIGGHCMMFFGYDDATGYLKTLNSWGEDWGAPFGKTPYAFDGGMGLLPYEYVTTGLVSDVWVIARESEISAPR